MIDISKKPITRREAVAQARIALKPETIKLIRKNRIPKGDTISIAKCAGILASKKVDELVPLCHTLPLECTEIGLDLEKDGILVKVCCKAQSKTGVEMEAMAAACICALTIYDMCKSIDRGAVIEQIKLMEKKGGRSGHYISR